VRGLLVRMVDWSSRRTRWVLAAALLLAGLGLLARRAVPRDLLPELAAPHLGLVAEWMGHPASEVADRVTRVVSAVAGTLPGVTVVRGTSMQGMAHVDGMMLDTSGTCTWDGPVDTCRVTVPPWGVSWPALGL